MCVHNTDVIQRLATLFNLATSVYICGHIIEVVLSHYRAGVFTLLNGFGHIIDLQEQTIYDWINPIYLASDVQAQIQERFENDSEIELQGFLKVGAPLSVP